MAEGLGEVLLRSGALTPSQVEQAQAEEARTGLGFAEALVALGFATETDLALALAKQLDLQYVHPRRHEVDLEFIRRFPAAYLRRYTAVPLHAIEGELTVAAADASLDFLAVDLAALSGCQTVTLMVAEPSRLGAILDDAFGAEGVRPRAAGPAVAAAIERIVPPPDLGADASGLALCGYLMTEALRHRAGAVHLVPDRDGFLIELRIGGKLQPYLRLREEMATAFLLRLRLLAGRLGPGDEEGEFRFDVVLGEAEVTCRLALGQTGGRPFAVLQVTGREGAVDRLRDLGLSEAQHALVLRTLTTGGWCLVAGPDRAARRDLVRALVGLVAREGHRVVSVGRDAPPADRILHLDADPADPVALAHRLDAARALDPDLLATDEVSDGPSLSRCLTLALSGLGVLGSVPAEHPLGVLQLLVGAGLNAALLAEGLRAILWSEPARALCPDCRRGRPAGAAGAAWGLAPEATVYRPGGGAACQGTGFAGQVDLCGILAVVGRLAEVLTAGGAREALREAVATQREAAMRDAIGRAAAAGQVPLPGEPAPTEAPARPPRILVVDDEERNRDLLRAYLMPGGYEILEAPDGEAALSVAEAEGPDLILLDVMMPKLDGFETCRRLREGERTKHIPICMVTALHELEERTRGIGVGADDFLTKPVDRVELTARVKSLLRISHLHGRLERAMAYARRLEETK